MMSSLAASSEAVGMLVSSDVTRIQQLVAAVVLLAVWSSQLERLCIKRI